MAGKTRPSLMAKTLTNVALSNLSLTDKKCIEEVFKKFEVLTSADVVEIEILRDWLWEIALNNAGGDFSIACQDIISRLDGLRSFAKERAVNYESSKTETKERF